MIIKSIHLKSFRSVLDETVECDALTALVGPNGSGKSCFLRALELFYAASPNVTADDFYGRDTNVDIEIGVTFTDLTAKERQRFEGHMSGNDMSVVRVFSASGGKNSGKYYGFSLQNPAFTDIRSTAGRELLRLYGDLRKTSEYSDLRAARSQADAEASLAEWEQNHKSVLELCRDNGQFFGFVNVGRGYLGDLTRFIFIPAVRDAGDDVQEGRTSPITELMDLVVRATLSQRTEIAELKGRMQAEYEKLTDPKSLPELGGLEANLTRTLQDYYRDTSILLKWLPMAEIDLPPPRADVRLQEDNFEIPVTRTGHGLQRAFILTLLQHLAIAKATQPEEREEGSEDGKEIGVEGTGGEGNKIPSSETPSLNLILGIEEPELYQHPSRQRHFARVLFDLAHGKLRGVADRTQIIYATHSALLVGIDRFNQIRRVRKRPGQNGGPKTTQVIGTTWDAVAEEIWKASGSTGAKFTGDTIKPRVAALMTPWVNEGFFADVAVLVEGEDDRAAILGAALAKGRDLESDGCTIIPCNGKTNLDRPAAIFSALGIATYVVWDSDSGKYPEGGDESSGSKAENHRLLRLMGKPVQDWPSRIEDQFACFASNLETTMREELGAALFDRLLASQQAIVAIRKRSQALKNPVVITEVLRLAALEGKRSQSLDAIVDSIAALRERQ